MSKYSDVVYGGSTYGATPKIAYSAEPMTIDVIKFQEAYITWQSPTGNFSRFRLVRNQNGYPETQEDGIVVYEFASPTGTSLSGLVPISTFKDGEDNPGAIPITPGRPIFYTIWLYSLDSQLWVNAGSVTDIIPSNSNVTSKLVDLLPRVFTSQELSPLGTVDPTSALYKFLDGMGFTYEQWLTQLTLLRPSHNFETSLTSTIPAQFPSLGLVSEYNIPTVNQRRLIRDAIYLYSNKGTQLGIEGYTKSLTGFATVTTVSPNLLLSVQDSTFYQGTGNWVATNATISAVTSMLPASVANAIDTTYTCQIVASAAGSMSLGNDDALRKGIPITSGNNYTYSFQVKLPTGSGTVTPTITFYDADDYATYSISGTPVSANNTWKLVTQTVAADEDAIGTASYVGLSFAWSAAGTYYVDMVCLQQGSSVSYDEARAFTLQLQPFRSNYINNPSFEVDATGWSYTGLTFSQDSVNIPLDGFPSLHSGKFTTTGSGTWVLSNNSHIPVDPGTYFNVSMYAYSTTISSMDMFIDVYDEDNNLVTTFSDTHMMGGTWMRHWVGGVIDSHSDVSYALVRFSGTGSGSFNIDMVMAEDTYTTPGMMMSGTVIQPTDYFDGSMPSGSGVVWDGAANNSISLSYPNKTTKLRRLAQTLPDWVPMNTFWRITTPAGLEYTNLTVV